MDTASNYLDGIKSAWLGEQYGAAFFNLMAKHASDESMQTCWRTLAQLETVTGSRMASLLKAHGQTAYTDEIIEISDEMLHQHIDHSHQESMLQMRSTIEKAIARYDQLLAVAPEEDVREVQFLVDHEMALLDFVDCELRGDHDHALDSVNSLLNH